MTDKCAFSQDLLQTFKEAATQGDNQMEYFSDQLCSAGTGAVTKQFLQELKSVQGLSDNPE